MLCDSLAGVLVRHLGALIAGDDKASGNGMTLRQYPHNLAQTSSGAGQIRDPHVRTNPRPHAPNLSAPTLALPFGAMRMKHHCRLNEYGERSPMRRVLAIMGSAVFLVLAPGTVAGLGYQQGMNLVAAVDIAVLGRTHEEGWGTVLSTIPTIATTILGLLIGELLCAGRPMLSSLRLHLQGWGTGKWAWHTARC